ncbi:AAA domain-containing protein [Methanomicrobium antiquum]|uniref:AAA domain-containing protein n=1 Tax=Methanomicrobium antiquum TaxID=487686 RepID=A0AAF0FPT3_9EURY|nr:AAA domain-containing protein [Methanomicrobium antiquum]WFN37440.1 AAA domain-containing protein [Methanomicrobium antiquum]
MNNLYYANLGEEDPEQLEDRVVQRLKDFQIFLNQAEFRLKKKRYKFSFSTKNATGKISATDADINLNPFSSEGIFLDEKLTNRIQENHINRDKKTIKLIEGPYINKIVYVKSNGMTYPFQFTPQEFTLNNIHPELVSTSDNGNSDEKRVREDEEDLALNFLSDSDTIEIKSKGKTRNIRFRNKLKREESIIVNELPENGTFWAKYNTYIIQRQRQAIEDLALSPQRHQIPLLNLFRQKERDFSWGNSDTSFNPKMWFLLTDKNRDGTDEQREFVRKAWGTPDFAILEGPPGSGKTTTILELIAQAISRNQRVLMVASTHVAVDNVIEKLLETYVQTAEGEKTLKEACGAIPLRIGDEDNVSDLIKPYCLNNFVENERNDLINFLNSKSTSGSLTESQKIWNLSLTKNKADAKKNLQTLLLDVANLICGTTIGILQAPIIKNTHLTEPLFDLVILDEASKTTFQEFLVPALYGRKWILSGDVKQLSPYVDQTPIEENLSNLPSFTKENGQKDREICFAAFQASGFDRGPKNVLMIKETDEDVSDFYKYSLKQAEETNNYCKEHKIKNEILTCKGISQTPSSYSEKLEILGSNFLIAKKNLVSKIGSYLPPDVYFNDNEIHGFFSDQFIRKRNAWNAKTYENKSWEGEIAWRISRMHELKNSADYDQLSSEVDLLIPKYERDNPKTDDSRKHKPRFDLVKNEIDKIRRIALPSVLELLQEGFETHSKRRDHDLIALYSGLSYGGKNPEILDIRHTLLTYQHRMHPDISNLPRKYIYEGKALKNANGDERMKNERDWKYNTYSSRCVWIDLKPSKEDLGFGKSKYNLKEVKAIKKSLNEFIHWAKSNPNPGDKYGLWSIAVLSFYKGQEKKLKDELADISAKNGISSEFVRQDCNISVKICSVDRFQGHEADLVFLSFVQSCRRRDNKRCKKSSIGFLNFQNRLNVAVTRARYQLVMFGDKQNFERSKSVFLKALATESTPGDIEFGGYKNGN